ncbi:MAG: hypothetical protein HY652_02840 [Acidobacteria bacterium]|nr:hypothetical protein [Acidobacteriota bacterium]
MSDESFSKPPVADPLYEALGKAEKRPRRTSSPLGWILGGLTVSVLGLGMYWVDRTFAKVESQLDQNEDQLSKLIAQVQEFEKRFGTLEGELSGSRARLVQQSQTLSQYRTEQEQRQKALEEELKRKADAEQVATLEGAASHLRGNVSELSGEVTTLKGDMGGLKDTTGRHGEELAEAHRNILSNRHEIQTTRADLTEYKKSQERDYFDFELHKNGPALDVNRVRLRLVQTNQKKKQYHLEISARDKRITKKNVPVDEPVYFYVGELKKPYEIVVKKVAKEYVVGYLSTPRDKS